ncbi:hypothetical protein QBC46DRAFT_349140 [Diplogelasinospora grovesii]|uniref:Uncharacterized protein n=1 Tax=Diplogelasinospora grovesii TaxID=303347 RepID=A0AAN6NHA8_9PEZI|nr:hypothetical protein QBC46DRAFT_349140 [Diplogelasinospora grovesii]
MEDNGVNSPEATTVPWAGSTTQDSAISSTRNGGLLLLLLPPLPPEDLGNLALAVASIANFGSHPQQQPKLMMITKKEDVRRIVAAPPPPPPPRQQQQRRLMVVDPKWVALPKGPRLGICTALKQSVAAAAAAPPLSRHKLTAKGLTVEDEEGQQDVLLPLVQHPDTATWCPLLASDEEAVWVAKLRGVASGQQQQQFLSYPLPPGELRTSTTSSHSSEISLRPESAQSPEWMQAPSRRVARWARGRRHYFPEIPAPVTLDNMRFTWDDTGVHVSWKSPPPRPWVITSTAITAADASTASESTSSGAYAPFKLCFMSDAVALVSTWPFEAS